MSTRNRRRMLMVAAAALAVVRPAPAYDPEAAFAKGTTGFGLQIGGGAATNVEGHRTVSDISFLTATLRVSHLFFAPFGSGLLRSAVEPGIDGRAECGLSLPAHLERTHREPEPGLQLRHGDRRRFVLLQVRAS